MANPRAGMSGPYEIMKWTAGAPKNHDGTYAVDLTTATTLTLSVRVHGPRIGDRVFSTGWTKGATAAASVVFTREFDAGDLPDADPRAVWIATLTIDGDACRQAPVALPIDPASEV